MITGNFITLRTIRKFSIRFCQVSPPPKFQCTHIFFPSKLLFTRCAIISIKVTSHLKCIRLVSVRSSLPCNNTGVQLELI